MTQTLTLKHGDCVEVLATLSESSIGSVICDPPYGLAFMGKDFDKLGEGESQQLWHKDWLEQAYKVLKPGGIIKAFSGTRTYHRLAAAMEDTGFVDIRLEAWTYGSGFPKSLNIGKALDKAAGVEREVVGYDTSARMPYSQAADWGNKGKDAFRDARVGTVSAPITVAATNEAKLWDGWGTALKPAWEPVLVGRKK